MKKNNGQVQRAIKVIRGRDNYCCQVCNGIGKGVHHIFSRAGYPNLKYDKQNMILLCKQHHDFAEVEPNEFKGWFAKKHITRWEYLNNFINKQQRGIE